MSDISKLFYEDIRNKKMIGSNIFSRTSTRKGGTNKALKTPYLYMSGKERNKLNGEVVSYSMKDVIPYSQFIEKDEDEQKRLLTYWRKNIRVDDIIRDLGVSSKAFYDLVDKFNLPKLRAYQHKKMISNEAMSEILHDETLMLFSEFKELPTSQQLVVFNNYVDRHKSIVELSKEWDDSDLSYLYAMNGKIKRHNQLQVNNRTSLDSEKLDQAENRTTESQSERLSEDFNTSAHDEQKVSHKASIQANGNSFSFTLSGEYDPESIVSRLNILITEIENSKDNLKISIAVDSI